MPKALIGTLLLALLAGCKPAYTDLDACTKVLKLLDARGVPTISPEKCEQNRNERRNLVGDKEADAEKQCVKDNDTLETIEPCLEKQMGIGIGREPDVA